MTEIESLMTTGVAEMTLSSPVTASINGTVVTGIYIPGDVSGQLGYGGLVAPETSEFSYVTAAITVPSLLTTISVSLTTKRVMSVQQDAGITTLSLAAPEDVR